MSIKGSLADFSLPEIFQFIEKGHKTGLLVIHPLSESPALPSVHYLWMNQGRIVAAANQLNERGLIELIDQYSWVSNRVVIKLAQFCPPNKPLGLYLRSQGALQVEQLEHLFQVQVFHQLCALFQLKDAQFQFDQTVSLPMREMTGLSVPSAVLGVTLQKLVILKKLFELRKNRSEKSGENRYSGNFCHHLSQILDIAYFHSLNFSLFDTDKSLTKLYQVLDFSERPYNLPKKSNYQTLCCTS
ncbi:MAG: DUF4388 domain-containing protein [Cyanobacteriota bacterium]